VDTSAQDFETVVGELDAADLWFLRRWAEMLEPARRVFVIESRPLGQGPLVVVGATATAA
jgi:hypothetical protein